MESDKMKGEKGMLPPFLEALDASLGEDFKRYREGKNLVELVLAAYHEGWKDAVFRFEGTGTTKPQEPVVKKHEAEMLEAEMVMRDLLNEVAADDDRAMICTDPTCHQHASSQNARKWLKARYDGRREKP